MANKERRLWHLVDRLEGDKVVWIIALMLLLISVVCIFSSSSRLLGDGQTRLDIVADQLKMVGVALLVIILCYNIRSIGFLRWCSKWGFFISLTLLVLLQFIGSEINGAVRIIKIGGFQLHVFEVVKVAMVMYMSWAVDAIMRNKFTLLNTLATQPNFRWLGRRLTKKIIFIYLPFIITTVLVMTGSNSSALLIGGIMLVTIVIGGGEWKELAALGLVGIAVLAFCLGAHAITRNSAHPAFQRIATAVERIAGEDQEKKYIIATEELRAATTPEARQKAAAKRLDALDKLRQPYSAKIAISQGGFTGKGPGQSTQRYVVPDMSEDYMFSFILEEYGFLGALIVIALYVSLVARGSLIVRNCGNNVFAKTAVAGLCLLISGQAFLHICVNADLGPMTGQTLPLLSHGNFALMCFALAFGIILSISRIAQKGLERETRDAKDILATQTIETPVTTTQDNGNEQLI
ncbi:MAG: FtsW/RodA/SpoVE family cell cycle protein [Bacteroidales bacterium]|nr:FtsW/RodA/SpoVE family cell cycle protein [Candidatus Cryptobacteroides aphodequi]